ncbi:hypothetical protein PRNP1_001081 [Phytophthora ramorum]
MDDEEESRKVASATAASASASSTGRASSSGASPSSSATLGSSTASAPASMGIFYPLERDDSVNIIEEGEEHDLEADAFADMAMSGMDMNLEINTLNSVQIRAFLARNETSSENSGHFSAQASTAGCSNAEALQTEATKLSAYEVLRNGDVHYSRREDKMRALQEHPVVSSVASDGRTVGCKCGRNVRLNPPWYILKFEQHVASRNCTFLRQSRPRTKKRKLTDRRDAGAEEQQVNRRHEGLDSGSRSIPRTTDETEDSQDRDDDEFLGRDGKNETEEVGDEGGSMDDSDDYALQSLDRILRREFGVMKDGQRIIMPPADNSPEERIRMFKGAIVLRDNPQFKRITPDGRFAECECARIVLLGAPWQPGQFLMHVADKQKPKKRAKPASAAVTSAQWKKKRIDAATPRTLVSSGVLMSPPTSASVLVQANKSKKSFPREIRWDIARARGLLPCPGLRDERMDTFVSSAIQLTGGARHRQKIARELFPHLFPDSLEYSDEADAGSELNQPNGQSSTKKRQPKLQQLLEAEKLLLHDVIEGEALWFVDKDGNSVRSLDCLGIIDSGKGEGRCASCAALRSNSALRTAAATKYKMATRPGPPRNPINRKFCSGRVCPLLEAEFDMQEPFARVLRDLALAEIPSGSGLNTWMQMATMGLSGDFNTHPALLGLTESMVRLKDKEQRGVGLQNMTYSDLLDTFMRSLADLSPEACELFQRHLGGRKQRQLLAMTSRNGLSSKRKLLPPGGSDASRVNQEGDSIYGVLPSNTGRMTSDEGFVHLLDPSVVGLGMPNLSIGDIQDVDLSSFPTSSAMQNHGHQSSMAQGVEMLSTAAPAVTGFALSSESSQLATIGQTRKESDRNAVDSVSTGASDPVHLATTGVLNRDGSTGEPRDADSQEQMESDPGAVAFLTELGSPEDKGAGRIDDAVMPSDHVPCTGLRDENVQAYVANAVQIVGGSRPRYVIARELFPRVFGNDKKVRIVDKLNDEQRLVLQDAVFSECLWRVDKEGRCVRSLRCRRFVPASEGHDRAASQSQGVCRACRDLRTVPNFRSVLSRSKTPRKLENIKYVPSVYTESDPFLRKLSKNSAFRGLYQTVKQMASPQSGDNSEVGAERLKEVHFWLRFARMGVFGHFKSHPVFEGLMKSMVEVKDKERRGVGKQNMQYSQALDDFMQGMAQISTEAFELFAAQFCGRTLRSQKVKRRSSNANPPVFSTTAQTSTSAAHGEENSTTHAPLPATLPPPQHQHYLIPPDDLLGGRSLSTEESQRFMDRMLDEVRLSVSREMQFAEDEDRCRSVGNAADIATGEQHPNAEDDGPETYLNDEGVLTTEI